MQKRRYEILLPLQFNDGSAVPVDILHQTREELVAQFAGVWVHEGTRYEDSLVRIVVDVEDTPDNRQFFVDWKPTLRERFQQIEIYFTSFIIEVT
jgi:hypothetical protein